MKANLRRLTGAWTLALILTVAPGVGLLGYFRDSFLLSIDQVDTTDDYVAVRATIEGDPEDTVGLSWQVFNTYGMDVSSHLVSPPATTIEQYVNEADPPGGETKKISIDHHPPFDFFVFAQGSVDDDFKMLNDLEELVKDKHAKKTAKGERRAAVSNFILRPGTATPNSQMDPEYWDVPLRVEVTGSDAIDFNLIYQVHIRQNSSAEWKRLPSHPGSHQVVKQRIQPGSPFDFPVGTVRFFEKTTTAPHVQVVIIGWDDTEQNGIKKKSAVDIR